MLYLLINWGGNEKKKMKKKKILQSPKQNAHIASRIQAQ